MIDIAEHQMATGSYTASSVTRRREADLLRENEQLRATIAELEQLSVRDPLTGLLNKRAFEIHLESDYGKVMLQELPAVGLLRLDLDNFSWVNDFMGGHHFGDMYLSVLSNLIQTHFRGASDAAFRVGGDEFALLMPHVASESSFRSAAKRLHDQLNGKIFDTTVKTLLDSNRMVLVSGKKTERDGTVAMKELLRGLIDLRDNVDGARDHFLSHGRGSIDQKERLLTVLGKEDIDRFASYLADRRTVGDLTDAEQAERTSVETELAGLFRRAFPMLTVSAGGVLVTGATVLDPSGVDKYADGLVTTIKRSGGGNVVVAKI